MNLEYLRHGKALCGKVFRRFVETFNFHNDFISNLKGDADLPVVGGKIHLDRRDELHPVIRCRGCGSGAAPAAVARPQCFDLETYVDRDTGAVKRRLARCYYMHGGVITLHAAANDDGVIDGDGGGISDNYGYGYLAVCINLIGSGSDTAPLVHADTLEELVDLQRDPTRYIYPLYRFKDRENGSDGEGGEPDETPPWQLVADLRNLPNVQVFDVLAGEGTP